MKLCGKCHESKQLEAFSRLNKAADGRQFRCKECVAATRAATKAADPERWLADKRRYAKTERERNPDKIRERNRKWRESNPDKMRAMKKHRTKDPDSVLAERKRFYARHRDRRLEASRACRAAKVEEYREKGRAAYQAKKHIWHAAKARRRARKSGADYEKGITLVSVIEMWGSDCYICGIPTDEAASVMAPNKAELEHVIPLAKGGSHTMANLRCACHRCNALKGPRYTAGEVRIMLGITCEKFKKAA